MLKARIDCIASVEIIKLSQILNETEITEI